MRTPKNKWYQYLYPAIMLGVMVFFIYECNYERNHKQEMLQGIWLIYPGGNSTLLTISTSYGYKIGEYTHIRVIDPVTGKILQKASIKRKPVDSFENAFITSTTMWLPQGHEWICLDFPSLKKRWNQKSFFKFLKEQHSEVGEPFSMKLLGTRFFITNTQGKIFDWDVREFESSVSTNEEVIFLKEQTQLGSEIYYVTPETRFMRSGGVSIGVEEVEEKKEYIWDKMNISEKLIADTGFARNYAIFTPDSMCYFFDGNHARVAKKMISDSLELKWISIFSGREWLEGDFIRPVKKQGEFPPSRMITVDKNKGFVHYWTSLDKKENHLQLAAVDLGTDHVIWDIDLTPHKVQSGFRPERSMVLDDILIILWMNGSYQSVITGIEIETGKVKWVIKK